jgi:histone H3-like centromeric protein A
MSTTTTAAANTSAAGSVEEPQFQFIVKQGATAGQPQPQEPVVHKKKRKGPKTGRKYRFHPGKRAEVEIRRLQKTDKLLLQKKPFHELVREIAQKFHQEDPMRFSGDSLTILQETAENYIVELLAASQKVTSHRQAQTVTEKDMNLAIDIRGDTKNILAGYTPVVPENSENLFVEGNEIDEEDIPSSNDDEEDESSSEEVEEDDE